jgi:type IV conjugative transfer system protein TraL
MKTKVLLKHLDSPVRILSFSINDLIWYAAPFFIGALCDSLLIVPFFGLTLMYFIKRCLKRLTRFYLIRYLYWALPTLQYDKILRVALPSSSKRFLVK